ncbi:peptidyl-tRNA hydrolase [Corynebacterium ulcerans]|uniref:aminoacyl-tRNA hydrolase n=1 Tax=Corynebacterium ulcerans TaxID=65058 RepID=UPI00063421BA|nr:aminoacyl-tRNA hydrolase [Corynebacterium ulcerans]KKO87725.1 peptidyl-tRNA hydrolase [Corynebacterium ulcerans]KPJ24476.1 peptidyl-tRNA hydrolase [Corynebacterium ulcerans]BDV25592.1 peptidyl-tRNA hydrolase 1 [Corynebacterium ulcerans]
MTSPFLVVGLGNPGPQYATTRHNIGYMAIDELLTRASPMPAKLSAHKKTNMMAAETRIGTTKAILATPRSFMNLSGGPVRSIANFFNVPASQVIVLFDDLELGFSEVKAKRGGGDHGHNGLRSITQSLGTKDYIRVGIGIGRPPGRMEPKAFVLKPFSKKELVEIPIACADAADEVERIITNDGLS